VRVGLIELSIANIFNSLCFKNRYIVIYIAIQYIVQIFVYRKRGHRGLLSHIFVSSENFSGSQNEHKQIVLKKAIVMYEILPFSSHEYIIYTVYNIVHSEMKIL